MRCCSIRRSEEKGFLPRGLNIKNRGEVGEHVYTHCYINVGALPIVVAANRDEQYDSRDRAPHLVQQTADFPAQEQAGALARPVNELVSGRHA